MRPPPPEALSKETESGGKGVVADGLETGVDPHATSRVVNAAAAAGLLSHSRSH